MARGTTSDELLHRWLDHTAPTRSPTTIRGYRFKMARIFATLGHLRLDKITGQDSTAPIANGWRRGSIPAPSTCCTGCRPPPCARRPTGAAAGGANSAGHAPTRRHRSTQIPGPDVVQTLIARAEERGQPVLAVAT